MSTIRVGRHEYPEDIFADTRMSFGDHIEELRTHLIRAGIGLTICLLIGFAIDGLGYMLKTQGVMDYEIGVGRPAMYEIQGNVTECWVYPVGWRIFFTGPRVSEITQYLEKK